jgi:uncharacterized membrane-anchored protein YitT (DUF2179 family)
MMDNLKGKTPMNKENLKHLILAVTGAIIFSAGMNLFMVPAGFYSSGLLGIGQVIRTGLMRYLHISMGNYDAAGIIFLIINMPMLLLAYLNLGRKFFVNTIICISFETVFLTFIKGPSEPILNDALSSAVIGGVICGYGIGLTLKEGGSCGGLDILGMYLVKKNYKIGVGKVSFMVNSGVYLACALMFDIRTAVYSLLSAAVYSFVLDRVHTQNIITSAVIVTDNYDILKDITEKLRRSATVWKGQGTYSRTDKIIIYTVVSKYEARILRTMIEARDPNAFSVFAECLYVKGNFEKHL